MTDTTPTSEVLAGLVERVTFHSQESGFCVLRVKARGHRDLVTTIGHAAMISAGEWITASAIWLTTAHFPGAAPDPDGDARTGTSRRPQLSLRWA